MNVAKRRFLISVVAVLLILALSLYILYSAHRRVYAPFYIVDGDTVYKDALKFRFVYIDTPELHRQKSWVLSIVGNETCLKEYAHVAKNYTAEHLRYLEYWLFWKDKYGRYLAEPFSEDGELGLEMVRRGLAICYYREAKLTMPDTIKCLEYENEAKAKKEGLWSCASPLSTPAAS